LGVLNLVNQEVADYLRILQKINEIYSRYEVDDDKDLLDEINYYEGKDNYSEEEIKKIQNKCEIEWKDVLIKLFDGSIVLINSNEDYKKILNGELDQAKKVKQELIKEQKTLDEYEKIFDYKLNDLRKTIEREIAKYGIEHKRYIYSIIIAIIIAIGAIIFGAYLQKWGLLNWI
jgi:hypothetical protein